MTRAGSIRTQDIPTHAVKGRDGIEVWFPFAPPEPPQPIEERPTDDD